MEKYCYLPIDCQSIDFTAQESHDSFTWYMIGAIFFQIEWVAPNTGMLNYIFLGSSH